MKRIAILQSNYLPWKGYFDIINRVDCFVFLDTAQYTLRDWRNRNLIKTPQGLCWLTVPTNGSQAMAIQEVQIDNTQFWAERHLKALELNYRRTPCFNRFFPAIRDVLRHHHSSLSELNQCLISLICSWLKINTQFYQADDFVLLQGKNEKIISLVQQLGGTHYLTGPAAKNYIIPELFDFNGITLEYMDYSHYLPYDQPWGAFEHGVTILDLLFCCGAAAADYIWGVQDARSVS
jgi:hypothetical protein